MEGKKVIMEYLIGFVVGLVVAGMIGRAKFLQVQNRLRTTRDNFMGVLHDYEQERSLNDGLTQELADRTR